jgi:hypothetical protein
LPTKAGPADIAYLSGAGRLTIAECKLWRNPEARREVVAQVLDYAKEIARWSYEDLEAAVKRAAGDGKSLADRIRAHLPDLDEAALHDDVQANLSAGRLNLLVVGDGIREGVAQLVDYLTRDVILGYRFGIELAVYRMPTGAPPGFIVQPRILARTTEINRFVVQAGTAGPAEAMQDHAPDASAAARRLSERDIRASLAGGDSGLLPLLDNFLTLVAPMGLLVSVQRSITLHWELGGVGKINFGSIFPGGKIATNYICESARRAGDISIGELYLERLAALVPGASVRKAGEPWTWKAVVGRDLPPVRPLLEKAAEWRAIIAEVQERFQQRMPLGG